MEKTELQKEIDRLGILTIEAAGDLTQGLMKDVIDVVKNIPINFKQLAKEANNMKIKTSGNIAKATLIISGGQNV